MYAIGPFPFGYQLIFSGHVDAAELLAWFADLARHLESAPREFGLLLDLRALAPMSPSAMNVFGKGLQLLQNKGLQRTAVIVPNASTRTELTRQAKASGVYQWERYLCIDEMPDWRKRATTWIGQGIDPDSCDNGYRGEQG